MGEYKTNLHYELFLFKNFKHVNKTPNAILVFSKKLYNEFKLYNFNKVNGIYPSLKLEDYQFKILNTNWGMFQINVHEFVEDKDLNFLRLNFYWECGDLEGDR